MTFHVRVTLEEKVTLDDLGESHVEESVDQVLIFRFMLTAQGNDCLDNKRTG